MNEHIHDAPDEPARKPRRVRPKLPPAAPEPPGPLIIVRHMAVAERLNEWGFKTYSEPTKLNGHLDDADVVIVVESADDGRHFEGYATIFRSSNAKRVRMLLMPSPVLEWIDNGGDAEGFQALIDQAEDVTLPSPDPDPDAEAQAEAKAKAEAAEQQLIDELARLAKANALEYDRRRGQAADSLGVSRGALDRAVRARREALDREAEPIPEPPLAGHWVVEPWPEEVDGDALISALVSRIRLHMAMTHEQAVAVALWIMFAWLHEAATHSPILLVTSAVPGEGKTQLLGLVSFLTPRGYIFTEPTPAAIYQFTETYEPTLCVDDADDIFGGAPKLRAIINGSWTRSSARKLIGGSHGKGRAFSTWCPKAFGMIGRNLPASTLSRCVVIKIKKRLPTDNPVHFRQVDDIDLGDLRRQCMRWAMDHIVSAHAASIELPNSGYRTDDNWAMQFAVAHLVGGEWPMLAQQAAAAIAAAVTEDDDAFPVQVLADIKRIFDDKGVKKIHSEPLVAALNAMEGRPWGDWKGRGLTKWTLAEMLKGFDIKPDSVRVGKVVLGGYQSQWFADAFARYLPTR